jgi:hypothetical protein
LLLLEPPGTLHLAHPRWLVLSEGFLPVEEAVEVLNEQGLLPRHPALPLLPHGQVPFMLLDVLRLRLVAKVRLGVGGVDVALQLDILVGVARSRLQGQRARWRWEALGRCLGLIIPLICELIIGFLLVALISVLGGVGEVRNEASSALEEFLCAGKADLGVFGVEPGSQLFWSDGIIGREGR